VIPSVINEYPAKKTCHSTSAHYRLSKEVQSTEPDTQLSRTVFRDTVWTVAKQQNKASL
jgi:hypothetical protein